MTAQLDIFSPIQASRVSTVYHNTTQLKGQELNAAQTRASKQTEVVLRLFQQHPRTGMTPWDVYHHLGQQYMITSIRRSITTLTDAGYLEKTSERRKSGPAGETNYVWRLTNQTDKTFMKREKYPMTDDEIRMALALGSCRFLPGSFDKHLANSLHLIAVTKKEVTESQREWMYRLLYKYRKQLPGLYEKHKGHQHCNQLKTLTQ